MTEEIPMSLDVNQKQLMHELFSLPVIIQKLRKTFLEQEERYLIVMADAKEYEIETATRVHADESFKNQQSRDWELKRRLKEEEAYLKIKSNEKKLRAELETTRIDIEYCLHRLRSMHVIAKFFHDEED